MFLLQSTLDRTCVHLGRNFARPIAASAAATVKINNVNICPPKSFMKIEKDTKFMFTANNISSILIKRTITFFLFKKIPTRPIVKIIAPSVR